MNGRERILLTSVFQPCGVDDAYGRKENKIDLYHNQITPYQGIFSHRDRSWSFQLHVLASNLEHPVTVLDWPTLKRYEREIQKGYDYIGISFIQPNFLKAKKMAELARELAPGSKIILGGYGTMIDDIERTLDVDYVCRGEGIQFMRRLLGEPEEFQFRHPLLPGVEYLGTMGISLRLLARLGRLAGMRYANKGGVIVTGVGCAGGCDFCSTGQFFTPARIPFIERGREVFGLMRKYEELYGIRNILFVGDENVFSDQRRAEELHQCLKESGKYFGIQLSFSSLDYLSRYDPAFLSELGLEAVWIGIESRLSPYRKNDGVDIAGVVSGLHRYGIRTILSSILCLDAHTRENIWEDIDYHLSLRPVYSQFAHYSPSQGTALWRRMIREDRILHVIPLEDRHAFKQIWFQHPHFSPRESELIQRAAYEKEFHQLGPSFVRVIRTNYEAYPNLLKSKSEMLHRRAGMIRERMGHYRIILRAAELLAPTAKMSREIRELRKDIERDFGKTRLFEQLAAAAVYPLGKGEEARRKLFGDAIQPPTMVKEYNQT